MLTKLSNRHHQVILLAALGMMPAEIAARLHYTRVHVSTLLQDPLIAAKVDEERAQFKERISSSLEQDLLADAPNTFKRLKEIRDHPDPEVAVKGCVPLWDRQVLKRTIHDETHTTRIIIEKHEVQRLKQVQAEGRVVDGSAT